MDFFLHGQTSGTLSYIGWYRYHSPTDLITKGILLMLREIGYKFIHGNRQFFSFLPCLKLLKLISFHKNLIV